MSAHDNLRFDATDAWAMFGIWLSVNGHQLAAGFAAFVLIAILWADSRSEKKGAAAIRELSKEKDHG